jgi:lincosamide nucleotidyltransferase A/C/D/E
MKSEMTARSLVTLLNTIEGAGIDVWLDGGWGVDALLGSRHRAHHDVDLIVRVSDTPRLREILSPDGFRVDKGSPPHSFILANGVGLEIDIHAVVFDGAGNGVYRMENGRNWIYPAPGFDGRGTVAGRAVRCLTPEVQMLCHADGYEPVEKDYHDMELLAKRFRLDLPSRLQRETNSARTGRS